MEGWIQHLGHQIEEGLKLDTAGMKQIGKEETERHEKVCLPIDKVAEYFSHTPLFLQSTLQAKAALQS